MEAMDDPSVLTKMSRGDLYVQMGRMRAMASSPAFSMTHRLQYMRLLADMAKVMRQTEIEEATADRRPTITIVLQGGETVEASAAPRVIEGTVLDTSPPEHHPIPNLNPLPHGLLPLPEVEDE